MTLIQQYAIKHICLPGCPRQTRSSGGNPGSMPANSGHPSAPSLYTIFSPLQYSKGLTLCLFDRLKSVKQHQLQ
jgi:hypothetical protein